MHKTQPENTTEASTPLPPERFSNQRALLTSVLFAAIAGLIAGLLAVVVMGLLFLLAGIPTPVELFGDFVLQHIDVTTFLRLLITFAPNSKTAPLGLALLGMLGIGVLLGWLYAALVRVSLPTDSYRPARREWLTALAFTVGMTLIGVVLFWNELRQNLFGPPLPWAMLLSALGLLLDFSVYSIALCLLYRALLPRRIREQSGPAIQKRRQLLTRLGVAMLGVGTAAGTVALLREYLDRYTWYDGLKTWPRNNVLPPITPNREHYVVTQNAVDPTPNSALWRLEIVGLVGRAGIYTYEEIQQLPSTSRAITLECIANGVGDHLISTAIWHGVALRTLLERHGGALPTARYIAFYSVDGYNMSLPLNEVLEVDPILAWRMNGAELPQRHGYPLRVVIPGRFGEENPKWLTRIELTDHFVHGLYSSQGWYNGPLHTMSRIDRPGGKLAVGQVVEIGGIAFAGNRGIQKVEVSTDNGQSWQQATLDPPLSGDSWVFWKMQWRPERPGNYTLVVRATDGTGAVQTSRQRGTVPNGATGYHRVKVMVE
jgi:DMSO/TMAO reductase YedYZ molybdopterin-dependent catalytic subunit